MHSGKLLLYDLLGFSLTAGVLGLAAWCGLVDHPRHRSQARQSREVLGSLDRELVTLISSATRTREKVKSLEADIASRGALPDEVPVEEHLRLLDRLARSNAIDLVQVNPVGRVEHESLTETRYEVRANCAFPELIGFLGDFHESPAWADITDIQLSTTADALENPSSRQSVRFVLSLYARRSVALDSKANG